MNYPCFYFCHQLWPSPFRNTRALISNSLQLRNLRRILSWLKLQYLSLKQTAHSSWRDTLIYHETSLPYFEIYCHALAGSLFLSLSLLRRPSNLVHLILLINFYWQGAWLMMVKRIESRVGKTGPKKSDCWADGNEPLYRNIWRTLLFAMPSNYSHRPVVIIPITAKTEKSVTHSPGTRWRQGQSSTDQYFIYSLRLVSIPVSNSLTESHERNEVCWKTPNTGPSFPWGCP